VAVQRVLAAIHRDRDTRDAGAHTTSVPGQLRVTYTSRQRLWPIGALGLGALRPPQPPQRLAPLP
jgi:hypothetical protein